MTSGARWLEWLMRREALKSAAQRQVSDQERTYVKRAWVALREGNRLLDPPDGGRSEPALSMALFRDAAYWVLLAEEPGTKGDSLAELIQQRSEGSYRTGAPPAALLEPTARDFTSLALEHQLGLTRSVQRWLTREFESVQLSQLEVTRLRLERAVRIALSLVVVGTLVALVVVAGTRLTRGPNLAADKPWRTSSTYAVCEPERHWCASARTDIFFRTKDEDSPWLEIDLGKVQRVSRVQVRNRNDAPTLGERALPLVIEVSSDGQKYFQVAQRTQRFKRWNASFPAVDTRFVRLTVPRKTMLHLEQVSVFR